jgi:hypothetical protein
MIKLKLKKSAQTILGEKQYSMFQGTNQEDGGEEDKHRYNLAAQ